MKRALGIVRRLDPLGRIVIPKELRHQFDLGEGAPMEMFLDGEDIILRKYTDTCVVCGTAYNLKEIPVAGEKYICPECKRIVGDMKD